MIDEDAQHTYNSVSRQRQRKKNLNLSPKQGLEAGWEGKAVAKEDLAQSGCRPECFQWCWMSGVSKWPKRSRWIAFGGPLLYLNIQSTSKYGKDSTVEERLFTRYRFATRGKQNELVDLNEKRNSNRLSASI